MANYTKATNFTAKDSLPSGNAGKIIKGAEIDTEFTAIASAVASKADLNSPALTGTPTAPTAITTTNTTQVATTAFAQAVVVSERTATGTLTNKTINLADNTVSGTVAQFNTALSDGDFATIAGSETLTNKTLTSPTLSGTPVAPTANSGTNTTQIATTAFVSTAVTNERTASATLTNKTLTSPTINSPTISSPSISNATITSGTITGITDLAVADGGTGQSSFTNGQLLIGNSTGNTLNKATLTAGTDISVTNGAGSITINSTVITASSKTATSGYFTFGNGTIMQWGQVTGTSSSQSITFPIAFPNNVVSITAQFGSTGSTGTSSWAVNSYTTSGFVFVTGNPGQTTFWFAVGY